MSYDTRQQWVDLDKRTRLKTALIMQRIDALVANTVLIAPVGMNEGDETVTTRSLTPQERNQIKAKIVSLSNEVIADWQLAIAP